MSHPAEPPLVKLSAENLLLRQRLALLETENKRLRQTIGNRNQVIDMVTITKKEHSNE